MRVLSRIFRLAIGSKKVLYYSVCVGVGAFAINSLVPTSISKALCEKREGSGLFSRYLVADVVEAVSPAVVNILCEVESYMGVGASSGSGFIISTDGMVVTNAHVVSASSDGRVVVTLKNGVRRHGKVHSLDVKSDIALIKLDGGYQYPTVNLGSSTKIRSGEFVISIGSPMRLQDSVSFGIISAAARHASEIGLSNNRSEYIQTDASINVGNSGGPLVNLDGEVIGINTMKIRDTDGISFAIPIDLAQEIIKQLKTNGKVMRPYVGLKMAAFVGNVNASSRRSSRGVFKENVDEEKKVMVVEVVKGSPAHKAGIQSGDTLAEVNGKSINSVRDVFDVIGFEVGKSLTFKTISQHGTVEYKTLVTAPERQ